MKFIPLMIGLALTSACKDRSYRDEFDKDSAVYKGGMAVLREQGSPILDYKGTGRIAGYVINAKANTCILFSVADDDNYIKDYPDQIVCVPKKSGSVFML